MNTRILLPILSAAALAATSLNVSASDALLSPRAQGNPIKAAPSVTATQPAFAAQAVTPRASGNQIKTVATVANDVNPAIASRNMIASPKAIQACASNSNMPGCTKTVVADNMTR